MSLFRKNWAVGVFIGISILVIKVVSHGRLMDPPARNAMWRYGYTNPANYDDNQLWCGGAQKFLENGEKCGVCGDDYSETEPREHEIGGKYANSIVARRYAPGQIINTEIELTANHLGYFEFRLCPVKDETKEVTEECLDHLLFPQPLVRNKLLVLDEDGTNWDTKFYVTTDEMMQDFKLKVKLPHHISCTRCVFQWTYIAANTWGVCANGTEAKGCGPQEVFKNCADIGIVMNSGGFPPGKRPITITPPKNAIYQPEKEGDGGKKIHLVVRSQVCVATEEFKSTPGIDDWCQKNCLRYPQNCPEDKCKCLEGCHAIGDFKDNDGADSYCQYNCLVYPPKNCTAERCLCI